MVKQSLVIILLGLSGWAITAGIALNSTWSRIVATPPVIASPFSEENVFVILCAFVSLVFARIAAEGILRFRIALNL